MVILKKIERGDAKAVLVMRFRISQMVDHS
jgi:hypothetical protein